MGIFKKLFGSSKGSGGLNMAEEMKWAAKFETQLNEPSNNRYTPLEGMKLVYDLRKKQGWDGAFVEGETALVLSLVQAGESPESIAKATLGKDWPSRVARFAVSPDRRKIMGV